MTRQVPYDMLGGEVGVRALCDAFYDVMDEAHEAAAIRRMHKPDLSVIRQTFFEYMSAWLGGPSLYPQKYGSMCITEPHLPYAIGARERDMWLMCMDRALERIQATEETKRLLKEPLFNVANMLCNRA